jgi:hypothetical protein
MSAIFPISFRLSALCADWDNHEVNLRAGLSSYQRTRKLAICIQTQLARIQEARGEG